MKTAAQKIVLIALIFMCHGVIKADYETQSWYIGKWPHRVGIIGINNEWTEICLGNEGLGGVGPFYLHLHPRVFLAIAIGSIATMIGFIGIVRRHRRRGSGAVVARLLSTKVADKMVKPLFEREEGSAPGPFYVIKDNCITCSLPPQTAPENIQYHERSCTSCPDQRTQHCVVVRQPETAEELAQMIDVVAGSCVGAYRYCGTDPEILRRLVEAGCKSQCDALCGEGA